ncbi:MAG: hypothetical protein AAB631_00705 [Patescibacteria group bacterium]
MSICKDGVKFERPKEKKSAIFLVALITLEAIFTFFLYLSLAQHVFDSPPAESAAGIPSLLSYQGRLTDASGNPLGGTGTVYCFRYSLYDAQTAGNKLWPAGTASNSTTTVVDGVFSDQIGRMDPLTYDFVSTSTVYLNVEVNQTTSTCGGTWETLAPRQQVVASGFALSASNVYGSALRTPTSTKVQVGTGAGVASGQTLLSLDVKNIVDALGSACTDNGSLWYNSANTRALLCENGTIQPVSNSSTTISAVGVNASTPVSIGTVVFSNSNNVTFGLNGSTITASITAAGGGGGQTLSNFIFPLGATSQLGAYSNAVMSVVPFNLGEQLTATRAMMMASISGNTNSSGTYSVSLGLYTRNVSTLSLLSSGSQSFAYASSQTSLAFGMRRLSVPLNLNLTPGDYWYAVWMRSSNNGLVSIMGGGGTTAAFSGNFGIAANSSRQAELGLGIYSNASFTTAMPTSIAITNIKGGTGTTWNRKPWILFTNLDLN